VTAEPIDEALSEARARLVHDLSSTKADQPRCVDVVDGVVHERRSWLEQWPDGAAFITCLVAQDVKEELAGVIGRWPQCPTTPGHELQVEPDLGEDPHWVCEDCALPVARVGELAG
jgi:hypothetical protein